jgi:hypothetical protein
MPKFAYMHTFLFGVVIIPLLWSLYALRRAVAIPPTAVEFRNTILSTMSVLTVLGYLALIFCVCAIGLGLAVTYRYLKESRCRLYDLRQKLKNQNPNHS